MSPLGAPDSGLAARITAQIDAASQGILVLDARGHVSVFNRRFLEIWRLADDAVSDEVEILSLLLDQCDTSSPSVAFLRQDGIDAMEECAESIRLKDGRMVESRSGPLLERGGIAVARVWHFREVSEGDSIDVQLRMLWRAVESSPATVVITDREGCIQYVNKKFSALTGYAREEVMGRNPSVLKSGVQDDAFYREMWSTLLDGREWRGDFCNRRKDGSLYWERAAISPISGQDGAISHFVAVKEDVTAQRMLDQQLQRAMQALAEAALHDPLTRLPNRTLLADRLKVACEAAKRTGAAFAVTQIDLTGFKAINDTYGHDAGDLLLKIVGERMSTTVRASDTVARTGGDEFVLVLPSTTAANAAEVAQKLRDAVREPIQLDTQTVTIDASFGISSYPEHSTDAETLLRYADQAMYVAKATGCGVFVFAG